jgi:hypothetical protein
MAAPLPSNNEEVITKKNGKANVAGAEMRRTKPILIRDLAMKTLPHFTAP